MGSATLILILQKRNWDTEMLIIALPKVMQLVSGRVRMQMLAAWLQSPDSKPRKNLVIIPKSPEENPHTLEVSLWEAYTAVPYHFEESELCASTLNNWEMPDSLVLQEIIQNAFSEWTTRHCWSSCHPWKGAWTRIGCINPENDMGVI